MDTDKIKEIEDRIAELKKRWPSHSATPGMWQELEDLEEELEEAQATTAGDVDADEATHGR
jgi:hypothetical protein